MVVNDLHLLWASARPSEADAPLGVDPDAVLTGPITFQRLEPVAGRSPQIVQDSCGTHLAKLAQRRPSYARIDGRDTLTTPQKFGVFTPERSDHATSI